MKSFVRSIVLVLFLFPAVMSGQESTATELPYNNVLDSALREALPKNKLVLIDCYMDPCVWCVWMEEKMFTIDSVRKFYDDTIITIRIKMGKGGDNVLADYLGVQMFPSYFIMNSAGYVVGQMMGVCRDSLGNPDPHAFIEFGRSAIEKNASHRQLKKEFTDGIISQSRLIEYMRLCRSFGMQCDAEVDTFIARQRDCTDSLSWYVIRNFASAQSSAFHVVLSHRGNFYRAYNADTVDAVLEQKYRNAMGRAIRSTPVDSVGYFHIRLEVTSLDTLSFSKELSLEMDLQFYERTGNWVQYATAANSYLTLYHSEDWFWLNNIAWNFYLYIDDPAELAIACKWAKHSVELDERYVNMDTYARLLYKQGKKGKAKKAARRAIYLAKAYNAQHDKKNGWIDYSSEEEFLRSMK